MNAPSIRRRSAVISRGFCGGGLARASSASSKMMPACARTTRGSCWAGVGCVVAVVTGLILPDDVDA
jgi:hypothetical protein